MSAAISLNSSQYWATFSHLKRNAIKLSISQPPSQYQMQNNPQIHIDWVVNALIKISKIDILQGILTTDRKHVKLIFASEGGAVEFKLRYL